MKVSVFGLGYVGCVSLGCLAAKGHKVTGVDVNHVKIDLINKGQPTIIEKDISEIIKRNWQDQRICATNDYMTAVQNTSISLVCVGTPPTSEGHLDLNAIWTTAQQIGEALKGKDGFHAILIRSTVLPGTNKKVNSIIEKYSGKTPGKDYGVISNPEFLREGTSVQDFYNPPMTVLGTDSEEAVALAREMYNEIHAPIEIVPIEVAELIKYVNNSFHALKITFANEVGNICKRMGVDSHELMRLFCMDTKLNISPQYLKPGFAYGGSCLPKDLKALNTLAHDFYLGSPVLNAVSDSNELQKKLVFDLILEKKFNKIGVLGLSFKKGTDDLRSSPMVDLVERLLGKGKTISIYDKEVSLSNLMGTNKQYIDEHIPHLSKLLSTDLKEVLSQSDLIVIGHKEKEFEGLWLDYPDKEFIDLVRIKSNVKQENYEGLCW